MKDKKVLRLVMSGLICAITCLLTMVSYRIPGTESAYANLGDAGVYLAAAVLGGSFGALAAAAGSALADIILASAIYAPATFIIKGLMALIAALLLKKLSGWKRIFALIPAGIVMPVGYFLYECLLYGVFSAAISIPLNLLQMLIGIVIGYIVILTADRIVKK